MRSVILQFFSLLVAATLSGLLVACSAPQHVPYHSTASIPHHAHAQQTSMELINNSDGSERREYAVLAAVDEGQLPHVILAPIRQGSAYDLENVFLGRSAPIQSDNLSELIDGVRQTLAFWDRLPDESSGTFFEFMHAPEQDIYQVSDNVVRWRSSIRYTFSSTGDGPTARLRIGFSPLDNEFGRVVDMKSRARVQDLLYLLETAEERMMVLAERS